LTPKILEKINKKKIVSKNRLLLLLKKGHKVSMNIGPKGCCLLGVPLEAHILRCYIKKKRA